jgi:hypothetical protein
MLLFFASCGRNKTFVALEFDPELMPTMITYQTNMLISDSGITRFRMVADVWKVFDRASEPHWFFPEGIYLEQFDTLFHIEATVLADTAWNFSTQELWRLVGNVQIENREGTRFTTEEMFWNQAEQRFFGNKFIEIIEADGSEFRGQGFEANQDLTEHRIRHPHNHLIRIVETRYAPVPTEIEPLSPSAIDDDLPDLEVEIEIEEQEPDEVEPEPEEESVEKPLEDIQEEEENYSEFY